MVRQIPRMAVRLFSQSKKTKNENKKTKNENKPADQPNKKLMESAKDTIFEKDVQTASAAFEYDEEQGDIIGGEAASIYRGPSDNANIQQSGRE